MNKWEIYEECHIQKFARLEERKTTNKDKNQKAIYFGSSSNMTFQRLSTEF